jgi:hypothetical protein
MGGAISLRLIAFLGVGLVLVGVAAAAGIALTPALYTVAAFVSAVVIVAAEGLRKLLVKPSGPDKNKE